MSKVCGSRREVEVEQRDQHQHRAEQRVEEELDRRVLVPRAAPDADQEVHRQEHDFPEDVEEEEVERDERRPSCRSRAAGRARSSPSRAFSIPNDATMQMDERSAVSSTIVMLSPSTPTKYSMLNAGIHGTRSTNWRPASSGRSAAQSTDARTSGGTRGRDVATQRISVVALRVGRQQIDGRADQREEDHPGEQVFHGRSLLRRRRRTRRPRPVHEDAAERRPSR